MQNAIVLPVSVVFSENWKRLIMATLIPFSSTAAGNNTTLASGEDLYVRSSTLLASTGGVGVVGLLGSNAITVIGEVYGDLGGIQLGNNNTFFMNSRISIGADGAVNGRAYGIQSAGSSISIVNSGYIQGNDGVEHNGALPSGWLTMEPLQRLLDTL